jgi:hypothetical protein
MTTIGLWVRFGSDGFPVAAQCGHPSHLNSRAFIPSLIFQIECGASAVSANGSIPHFVPGPNTKNPSGIYKNQCS